MCFGRWIKSPSVSNAASADQILSYTLMACPWWFWSWKTRRVKTPLYRTLFNRFKPTNKTFQLCSLTTRSTSFPMAWKRKQVRFQPISAVIWLGKPPMVFIKPKIRNRNWKCWLQACWVLWPYWICCAILWCMKTSVTQTNKASKPSRPSKKWRLTTSITPWMRRWFPPSVHPMSMWLLNRRNWPCNSKDAHAKPW